MVSGNESHISEPEPGIYQVVIQNMHTNATITQGGKTIEIPLSLALVSNSSAGAIELVNNEGDALIFMIQATNMDYYDENQTLWLKIAPLEYYDGTHLSPDNMTVSEIIPGSYTMTDMTLEFRGHVAFNDPYSHCCTFDQMDHGKCSPLRPLCGY